MLPSALARALKPVRDRLVSLVARAVVRRVTQGGLEVLQLETSPGSLSGSVERFGHYGLASATLPGAEAIRVCVLGSPDHPVAIAVDDRRHRPTNLAAGDVTLYNQHGDRVHLKASRELAVTVNGTAVTVNGSEIKLELAGGPAVTVNGSEIKLSIGASSITLTSSAIAIKSPAINLDP